MSRISVFISIILTSIIAINGQLNCSTYNPCGRYGYCEDNSAGAWKCKCKFWWDGTTCNVLTNGGKQVIALGCLSAFLIAIFYGFQSVQYIQNRKRQPQEIKKKEVSETKLVNLALTNVRRSAGLSSCIITVLMIIMAAAALVAEWSLIQPIHNEIVLKFQTNQMLYYVPNSFCDLISYEQFDLLTFSVSCFLILLFIITTKRVSLLRNACHGYGAPPMPIDFVSRIDRKFAAVIFAICADELLLILLQVVYGSSNSGQGVIVVYLLRILQVIVMGFRYYPFLAAVYINSILTLTCATLYAWLDYSITILNQGMCETDFYPTYDDNQDNSSNIDQLFTYFGTGPNLIAIQLCTDIPRFLCLAYVNVKLPMLLIDKIYRRFKKNLSSEETMLMKLTREQRTFFRISRPNSVEMLYVRNLLRSADHRPRSQALWARLIPKKIYEWRDDFRFSTRVLCIYSSIFLLLYFVTIEACVQVLPQLQYVQDTLQQLFQAISIIFIPSDGNINSIDVPASQSNFPVPNLTRPYLCAVFLTLTIIVIQLLVLLVNIRRNLFQSFRGDDIEIPRRQRSRYISYATGNIHFAGYFIGYLIWGFIIIAVFSALLCICIDSFITFGSVRLVEQILKAVIPSILFILFKQYLNKILAQYVFLQNHGETIAMNNRRLLMIFIYFNFFLDAFLGFISSIMRLIKSLIGGIIYMCRLDYSPLGRKLETFDGGFSAYCGFIHTECAHRHPVLLVFVSHLYSQLTMKQLKMNNQGCGDLSIGEKGEVKIKSSSRYIRKWKLAVFLIRNPTIVFFRKAFLNQLHIEEVRALNDIDNNDKNNVQRRLSIYTRQMSASRPSIVVENLSDTIERRRF